MTRALEILIVDDTEANCRLIQRFVQALGHRTVIARNGREAVEACRQQLPDLVLMDIMMPEMNGVEASQEIRALCGERWLPIVFLSARSEEADQIEVLDIGDDFLPKPVNLRMLGAKIKVMLRISEMQQRIADHATHLETYRRTMESEHQFTGQLLDRIIRFREDETGIVRRWLKPARHLSGDVVVQAPTREGALHLMIADSTGHGLAAAICTLPVVDSFFDLTERGCDIGVIARQINIKLRRILPTGRFVAAALLRIDMARHEVQVWNGGIPFVAFASRMGKVIQEWPSREPPLGALDDALFRDTVQTWCWPESGRILVSSDGIVEAQNEKGEFFLTGGLRAAIETSGRDDPFGAVIAAIEAHAGSLDFADDLSLVCIDCQGSAQDS